MRAAFSKRCRAGVSLLGAWLAWLGTAGATDFYWTNNTLNGNFTNAANWFTNGFLATTAPGAGDNVNFTNLPSPTVNWTSSVTNDNAYFNSATNSTVTLNIGAANSWWLTNSLVVGQNASTTATVSQTSGTLCVTNSTGSATMIIGNTGRGAFILNGGTAWIDQLYATNTVGGVTNSFVFLKSGTLNVLHGSTILATNAAAGIYYAGDGGTLNWNILGGTNLFATATGSYFATSRNSGDRAYITVTGPGTLWTNSSGDFRLGSGGPQNTLTVTHGGHAVLYAPSGSVYIGYGTQSNVVTVAGSNSVLDAVAAPAGGLILGRVAGCNYNQLIVTNQGVLTFSGGLGIELAANNGSLLVSDGSLVNNAAQLLVGYTSGSSSNSVMIENRGVVSNTSVAVGYGGNASSGGSSSNNLVVTGPGSTLVASGGLTVGYHSASNTLTIENGGFVADATTVWIGKFADSPGNSVRVTGAGSLWQNGGIVSVGTNAVSQGTGGSILVADGGTLEANWLISGLSVAGISSGIISNSGGIYQFATNTPIITANSANSIVLNNGTISFRGVTNANVYGNVIGPNSNQLVNITYLGANAFRLNSSSNSAAIAQDYTFDATGSATNYAGLELVNAGTLWRSSRLTIGGGGRLLASNATATVAAAFTSTGSVTVVNSTVRFASNVVISGSYRSDPSTNIFATNTTVTASGYFRGGPGDLFQFERDLTLQSTNAALFDLSNATMLFTNGTSQHLLDLTGSGAFDRGSNFTGIASVATNFALGALLISPNDTFRLTGEATNALYVGALDFGGLGKTNDLTLDINLYYDNTLTANAYLGGNTYDLAGAGMLIPYPGLAAIVPEPSALLLLSVTALLVVRRKPCP